MIECDNIQLYILYFVIFSMTVVLGSILKTQFKQIDNKVAALVQHCLYMIATGKWLAGARLPSVRASEREWDLNRLTIQKAFRQLEQMGLISARPKSGYYVNDNSTLTDVTRHRYEMEHLLEKLTETIRKETALSPLSTLRYLAHLEELRCRETPDYAFCECTHIQAQWHAQEISDRFAIPVMPMTLQQINRKRQRVPAHIHILLTTHFHYAELAGLSDENLKVVPVPIEASPKLRDTVKHFAGKVFFVELEEISASNIASDSADYLANLEMEIVVSENIEAEIERLHENHNNPLILLSPRNWGSVDEHWRNLPSVKPIEFRVRSDAWPNLAETLGMTLGSLSMT